MDIYTASELLNISQCDISEKNVKRAYKNLAREKHPDKGGSNEQFVEIQTAYNTLLNHIYSIRIKLKPKRMIVEHYLHVTLSEIFFGTIKEVEVLIKKRCETCDGLGGEAFKCVCEGKPLRHAPVFYRNDHSTEKNEYEIGCKICKGLGHYIQHSCVDCNKLGYTPVKMIFPVTIPRGISDGRIIFDKQEHNVIKYIIKEIPHSIFKRVGNDLIHVIQHITIDEALGGYRFSIDVIDGRKVLLQCCEPVLPGSRFVLPGGGMPYFENPQKYGNLYFSFNIVYPTHNIIRDPQAIPIFQEKGINAISDCTVQ